MVFGSFTARRPGAAASSDVGGAFTPGSSVIPKSRTILFIAVVVLLSPVCLSFELEIPELAPLIPDGVWLGVVRAQTGEVVTVLFAIGAPIVFCRLLVKGRVQIPWTVSGTVFYPSVSGWLLLGK